MRSEEGGGGGFLPGFLLGGIVGAALALLFSPRVSDETRETIREKGIELRVKAEEAAARARVEADEIVSRGRAVWDEQRQRLEEAVDEGRDAAARKRAELLSRYQVAKETGEAPEPEETAEPGIGRPERPQEGTV